MKKLVDALSPGLRVWTPTLSNESSLLCEELRAEPERALGILFAGVQFPGIDRMDYLALHPQARQVGWFMSPSMRRGLLEDRAELLPQDYRELVRHVAADAPYDVAIAQLTPPDADGWCAPGLAADFLPLVWRQARRRIAHLNPALPRLPSSFRVHVSELDFSVEAEAPLNDFTDPAPGATDARIGEHVAGLVRDGDTLQFGIGGVPLSLARALTSHRRLHFHGGMLSSSVQTLWEAGAMDADAPLTTGVVLGDARLRAFVATLPRLWLTDVRQTHDPARIAALPNFVAVNGAVEVDLFGQVNSERTGGVIQAGAGGLPAFAQGALDSPGGRSLICLPATAKGGAVSRIVPALDRHSLVTLPRYLVDTIVTEHGVARLRGLSVAARAQALIGVAAPEHRAALVAAWDDIARKL
ncbi:acetyl-CoA hydrolase [Variovorax paradoxus]|nr:acetyl-CoA hydrolase/transferase C-terminal domain-containing protein [Variovorax paradoxus]MBT2301919.1 acetyl-CoA hydrolase [Variovorax paradoxus]